MDIDILNIISADIFLDFKINLFVAKFGYFIHQGRTIWLAFLII